MSSLSPGEVVSIHLALLVSSPFIRIFSQADSGCDESEDCDCTFLFSSPWVGSRSRRLFDLVVAAFALLLLSPIMAICWVMVRFSSPGPVLFRQFRAGRNGEEFELYKFRSMRTASFAVRPGHTVCGDGRITAVGAFLRRYKMDEIPQFWNVLKGDMSLVGPRPKLAHHEGLQMPYRPGLTGQATLAFRHEERMLLEVPGDYVDQFYESIVKPIKARLDIDYMENATFFSDLRILWRTLNRCINCSSDASLELAILVDQFAPEFGDILEPKPDTAVQVPGHWESRFLPKLTDDLVGDLDDAA